MRARVPVAEVLGDAQTIPALAPGEIAVEAVIGIKVMTAEGDVYWCTRSTPGVTLVEELGALTLMLTLSKADVPGRYSNVDEGDDA